MARFNYRAIQANGALTQGDLEAEGRQAVFRLLEAKGWRLVSLKEQAAETAAGRAPAAPGSGWSRGKVTGRMLEDFTRLLSSLLAAGIPLSRALVILYKEASSPVASAK